MNLFNLAPLYAFSGVTAFTAILFIVYSYFWTAATSTESNLAFVIAVSLPNLIIAAVVFVLPLRGAHNRIAQEKNRALGDAGRRLQIQLDALHAHLDAQELDKIPRVRDAVGALESERALLAKIPTWPWSPDALRSVISALLLPIVLFLIQYFIQQLLAP